MRQYLSAPSHPAHILRHSNVQAHAALPYRALSYVAGAVSSASPDKCCSPVYRQRYSNHLTQRSGEGAIIVSVAIAAGRRFARARHKRLPVVGAGVHPQPAALPAQRNIAVAGILPVNQSRPADVNTILSPWTSICKGASRSGRGSPFFATV